MDANKKPSLGRSTGYATRSKKMRRVSSPPEKSKQTNASSPKPLLKSKEKRGKSRQPKAAPTAVQSVAKTIVASESTEESTDESSDDSSTIVCDHKHTRQDYHAAIQMLKVQGGRVAKNCKRLKRRYKTSEDRKRGKRIGDAVEILLANIQESLNTVQKVVDDALKKKR